MQALYIMEARDFQRNPTNMSTEELYAQMAWYRSWLSGTGFQASDEFLSHLLTKRSRIILDQTRMNAEIITFVRPQESLIKESSTAAAQVDKLRSALDDIQLQLEHVTPEQAQDMDLNVLADELQKALDQAYAHLDPLTPQRRALDSRMEVHSFQTRLMSEECTVIGEVLRKLLCMIRVEEEFKRRDDGVKSAAALQAWITNTESKYTPPVLPNYIHANPVRATEGWQVEFDPISALAGEQWGFQF